MFFNGIIEKLSLPSHISSDLHKYINKKISIYGNGKAESLNVAISSALILDKVKKLIK